MARFSSPSPVMGFTLVFAFELRSFKTGDFGLCVDDLEAGFSFSLSLSSGMSPAFRGGEEAKNSVSKDEGGAAVFAFAGCWAIMAVFCSSRSPQSLKSCSFNWRSSFWSARRLCCVRRL